MRPHHKFAFALAAGVLVLDQLSKLAVSSTLRMHQVRPILNGFLNLTLIHNTGIAFGLMAGQVSLTRTLVFLAMSLLAIGIVLWMLLHLPEGQKAELLALSLILGGALGNLLDRIRLGEVVDFIDIYFRTYHWPAFNVADAAISIGVALLLFRLVFAGGKASSAT